ncbi:MAG: D-2-hydroxyacid dehydrogenase [Shewanella sp.]
MKIIVLDGYTLNPGDLSWQSLAELGELTVFDRSEPSTIVSRCLDAAVVFTNKTRLSAEILAQLPQLRYIGVLATGTDVVDIAAATARGIVVTNVPNYGSDAVAQMVFAHMLHFSQKVSLHDAAVKAGYWQSQGDFCFTLAPLMSLNGKTLGLVGFGAIAQQVASIASAFGMLLLVHTRNCPAHLPAGAKWVALDDLLKQADVVSLHCPLTPATANLINKDSLALMKHGSLLINTARGGLVNETDLAAATNAGRLYAGLDVLSTEPPQADNPLLSANNVSISPHIAWATLEARQKLLDIALDNLRNFLEKRPCHQVFPAK